MLDFRFHPEARKELLEGGRYIKKDDPEQGELFKVAFGLSLDWRAVSRSFSVALKKASAR